jgi:hypothetical protein
LARLRSFIIGPHTITFDKLFKDKPDLKLDMDTFLYISVYKDSGTTYDFHFNKRSDAIHFVVALSHCVLRHNPMFFSITNQRFVSNLMLKMKLRNISGQKQVQLKQLMIAALFNSVSETQPEDNDEEQKEKFKRLSILITLCHKLKVPFALIRTGRYDSLKRKV